MKPLFALASILALAGCATAVNGFDERINFESVPAGAALTIARMDHGQPGATPAASCTTPCSVVLERGPAYSARFAKEGCGPVDIRLYPRVDSAFYYAIIPDFWTGGAYDIQPNPVSINMTCGMNGSQRAG